MPLNETNLTIDAVKAALNHSSNDLGTLCVSSNVNPWSKKKPVRYEKTTSAEWWLGTGNDYSLSIPVYNDTDTQLWAYLKPLGGSGSPYDLGHFRGYDHAAQIPLSIGNPPDAFDKRAYTFMPLIATSDGWQVSLLDLTGYGTLLLGVEVYGNSGLIDWASEESLGGGIDVDFSSLSSTELTLKFFLTDTYKAWGAANVANGRYALPRKTTADNPFWVDVPLNATPANPYVNKFTTTWDVSTNVVTTRVNTVSYTGTITVEIYRTDNAVGGFMDKDYTIMLSGTDQIFTENFIILDENTQYTSKLYLNGVLRDSYTWISMAQAGGQ